LEDWSLEGLIFFGFIVVWFVLQMWLFPRLGVPT
jgi:hypothetical protein